MNTNQRIPKNLTERSKAGFSGATPCWAKHDPEKGVVVYGPQGCGKTHHSEKLKNLFGKAIVIDGWLEGDALPDEAIALTNVAPSATTNCLSFGDVRAYLELEQ